MDDFVNSLRIAKLISKQQPLQVYIIGSGYPIIVQISNLTLVQFEIAIATSFDESEDEEEQRKRIEAEQNASNLGTLIGVAVGLLTPQDEIETEDFEMKLDM